MNDPTTIRRLYGRRQGHALRAGQAALVEELLPRLEVPANGPIDATALFGDDRPLELEIGFGGGEHLAGQAATRPRSGWRSALAAASIWRSRRLGGRKC